MSIPAYLWLTDENDSPIIGGSLVLGREGAIELKSVTHNICIPIDSHTGKETYRNTCSCPDNCPKRVRPNHYSIGP